MLTPTRASLPARFVRLLVHVGAGVLDVVLVVVVVVVVTGFVVTVELEDALPGRHCE